MGHTLGEWQDKVASLLRDEAGRDVTVLDVEGAGLRPAFAEHSQRHPAELVREVVGTGSVYLDLPAEWVVGVSDVLAIEYPARQNPPVFLAPRSWRVGRSVADVNIRQLVLSSAPAVGQYARICFLGAWPFPNDDAATDEIGDGDFEAVASLAAAHCCASLTAEAARGRSAAMATDLNEGAQRRADLSGAASLFRSNYEAAMTALFVL
jgi:hypothetical protein